MNPGELDKSIQIQELTKVFDDEGIQNQTWNAIRSPWAKVEDKIVRTVTENNKIISQVETNFTIRKNGNELYGTSHRILYNSIIYKIIDIVDQDTYWKIITKGNRNGNQT